jgi:hypothetical protein
MVKKKNHFFEEHNYHCDFKNVINNNNMKTKTMNMKIWYERGRIIQFLK